MRRVLLTVCLFCLALFYTALAVRGLSGSSPDEGIFAACGRLVEGRDMAEGWRKDCGIFPDPAPPPDPFHAPPRPLERQVRL
jgi:hypothetical protein